MPKGIYIIRKLLKWSDRHRRILLTAICAAAASASFAAAILCSGPVCYAVSYEGDQLAQVSSRAEVMQAVEVAEERASELLGKDCSLDGELSVTANMGTGSGSADELADMLLENMDGISKGYAITVDGVPVGTGDDPDRLLSILDNILNKYSTENTMTIDFAEKVSVEYLFINDELEHDPAAIAEALSPDNADSPCRLTILSNELFEITEEIPFETVYEYDDTGYSDESEVVQEGRDGVRVRACLVRLKNGAEVSSSVIGTFDSISPMDEIISVGSIPGSRTDSTGTYIWPTEGVISSGFGKRNSSVGSSNHKGIDIANRTGTDIMAADGGTVILAKYVSGYGNLIKIEHDNGDITYYAHLSKFKVDVGDKVSQGQVIAKMGSTGNSTGPHLHFEFHPGGGSAVNPVSHLTGDLQAG